MGKYRTKSTKSKNVAPGAFQEQREDSIVAMMKWRVEMMEKYGFTKDEVDNFMKVCNKEQFLKYCEFEKIHFSV